VTRFCGAQRADLVHVAALHGTLSSGALALVGVQGPRGQQGPTICTCTVTTMLGWKPELSQADTSLLTASAAAARSLSLCGCC
jgi:hypothetical protein